MRTIVLALACLACASQARRVAFNPAMPEMRTNPVKSAKSSVVRRAPMMSTAESGVSRRAALGAAVLAGIALAGPRPVWADKAPGSDFPVADVPKEFEMKVQQVTDADKQARLMDELKILRRVVQGSGKKSAKQVKKAYTTVLEPLQALLAKEAAVADSKESPKAKAAAEEMKGHMLELAMVLEKDDWAPYVSKSTGKTYKAGQVDRELEEIQESVNKWFKSLTSPYFDTKINKVIEIKQNKRLDKFPGGNQATPKKMELRGGGR